MTKTACIISIEHFNRDFPLSGGSLRVLGLKYLLQKLGFQVILLRPFSDVPSSGPAEKTFSLSELSDAVREIAPDLIVVEQWALLDSLPELDVPVICDLHGSLLAENWYKGYRDNRQLLSKCHALSKADAFFVPGERQYYYFRAWLTMVGFDIDADNILKVPLILDPAFYPAERKNTRKKIQKTIVYGGASWPWATLIWSSELADFFQAQGFEVRRFLYDGEQHEVSAAKSHRELISVYQSAFAAWDFYELNKERELAITTRTMEYLHCGLPVFYPQGLELSSLINQYNLGFTAVEPRDFMQIHQLSDEIMQKRNNIELFFKSENWLTETLTVLSATPILRGCKQVKASFFVESELTIRRLVRQTGELEKKLIVSEETRKNELALEVQKNEQIQKELNSRWEAKVAGLRKNFEEQDKLNLQAQQQELTELNSLWEERIAELKLDFEKQDKLNLQAQQQELAALNRQWEDKVAELRENFEEQDKLNLQTRQQELIELNSQWEQKAAELRRNFEEQDRLNLQVQQQELTKLQAFWEGEMEKLRLYWEEEGELLNKQFDTLTNLWQQDAYLAALRRTK